MLTVFLCCYTALSVPAVLHSGPLVQNPEKTSTFLPGVENLGEKSIPAARLSPTSGLPVNLPGNRNLGERIQIERAPLLPGIRNLAEKAIPEPVIFKLSNINPKSEYETI
uniref:Uncharacterized protein n=1 Tax=Bracon brevicornis TaxID=1563983 RepID=A0A6V7M021_9HYME